MSRMSLWREKKRKKALKQVCVWLPEEDEQWARPLLERIAEASQRGYELRVSLLAQLSRRRTTAAKWLGGGWGFELDLPLVGPWWALKNIGGRVHGPGNTQVELTPDEAGELKSELHRVCAEMIEAWARKQNLIGCLRDEVGANLEQGIKLDPRRPATEEDFERHEAWIKEQVYAAAMASRKPPIEDSSIVEYRGYYNDPGYCQVAHRRVGDRVQFGLIHMDSGGPRPTNLFERLATQFRQRFYPDVDPLTIDWYDVSPPRLYTAELNVKLVTMQFTERYYSDPTWSSVDPATSQDWRAFVMEIISRTSKTRAIANGTEEAPS